MAKKKSSSNSKSSRAKKKTFVETDRPLWMTPSAWDWVRIRRASVVGGWLLALALVVAAWAIGVPRLEAYAAARPVTDLEIRFLDPPAWMKGDLAAMLDITARDQVSGNPIARLDLVAVQLAMLDTGWFQDVRQVRRVRDDVVEIDALFVEPFAVIRDADGDHLVDPTGRLLPRTFPAGAAARLTVISGARFARPSTVGGQWDGSDVTAALRLLRLVRHKPWADQVRRIDLTDHRVDQTITLFTDRDSRILWGSGPGEESPLEASTERKLHYLDYSFQQRRHIDYGHPGLVDITNLKHISIR